MILGGRENSGAPGPQAPADAPAASATGGGQVPIPRFGGRTEGTAQPQREMMDMRPRGGNGKEGNAEFGVRNAEAGQGPPEMKAARSLVEFAAPCDHQKRLNVRRGRSPATLATRCQALSDVENSTSVLNAGVILSNGPEAGSVQNSSSPPHADCQSSTNSTALHSRRQPVSGCTAPSRCKRPDVRRRRSNAGRAPVQVEIGK